MPFQKYVKGSLPRTDLVIQNKKTGACLRALEVKLTALPDNTTYDLGESNYGCEIVIRPDTIIYLACSLASTFGDNLTKVIDTSIKINDWTEPLEVLK